MSCQRIGTALGKQERNSDKISAIHFVLRMQRHSNDLVTMIVLQSGTQERQVLVCYYTLA